MNNQNQPTLLDLCADVWRGKFYVLSGLALALICAGAFMASATPYYKAQAIISPASTMNGPEVSSLLADENLSALRFLVQRVGATNSADFTRFENTYSGPSVAEFLMKDPAIREGLAKDPEFGDVNSDENWNAVRVADYIERSVRLEPVGATTLRRMTYLHPSRAFGNYFLQNVHRLTDELIRQKIRQDAQQRVRYLQETVAATSNPDHKRALTALLLEQERLLMLVSIDAPYAASMIEPPATGVKAAWPNPMLIFPAFALAGMVVGFAVFAARETAQRSKAPQRQPRAWYKTDSGNNNQERRTGERRQRRDAA